MAVEGYSLEVHEFEAPPELTGGGDGRYQCVIIGAGLAGLSLAADLGMRGVPTVVVDQDASVGAAGSASRGVAYASRTLEFLNRLDVAERMREKAASWNEGRIFDDTELISHYVIQPEENRKWPAFLNIQQFYLEQFLADRIEALDNVEIRWQSRVDDLTQEEDGVSLRVDTPLGPYSLTADWVAACDGSNSSIGHLLGLDPPRSLAQDHWAITDVRVDHGGDLQRRFWLNVPSLLGGAAIVHAMADGLVRVDWQIIKLDPDEEVTPERVRKRVISLIGDERPFEVISVGRFRFKRKILDPMIHGRVIFLGDAAHEIPPFGARGGNGAIQDAENLGWKLAAVIHGEAEESLLETYNSERLAAATENARYAWQSNFFINPHTEGERLFRDAVLALARDHEFARPLINTGRPSVPIRYPLSALSVDDGDEFDGGLRPGEAAYDGQVLDGGSQGFLLDSWHGNFTAVHFVDEWPGDEEPVRRVGGFALDHVIVTRDPGLEADGLPVLVDPTGALFDRYAAAPSACYILRPDAYVAARGRDASVAGAVRLADRALGRVAGSGSPEPQLPS